MRSGSADASRGCWLRFSPFRCFAVRYSLFVVSRRAFICSHPTASCVRVVSLWCGIKLLLLLFIYLFLCVQYSGLSSVCVSVCVCVKNALKCSERIGIRTSRRTGTTTVAVGASRIAAVISVSSCALPRCVSVCVYPSPSRTCLWFLLSKLCLAFLSSQDALFAWLSLLCYTRKN